MHWQLTRRSQVVYVALALVWLAVIGWQAFEHLNVRRANSERLMKSGRDITSTLGIVLRSQRRFGNIIAKDRLEPALRELLRPGELDSIVMLSPTGEAIVSAGEPLDVANEVVQGPGIYWGRRSLTLMNLVDLGSGDGPDATNVPPAIVVSPDMLQGPNATNRPPFRWRDDRRERDGTNRVDRGESGPPSEPVPYGEAPAPRRDRGGRPPFGRPPWMSDAEYQELIQKRGVPSFVIALSSNLMTAANARDLWLRTLVAALAAAAAGISAFAWRGLVRSSELQIRLVKAGEMNAHLKEMNLAAAGLAHETRNPLNLIRGLAQMISREQQASGEVRERSATIVDEADRVTAQLNEFINYSRPREVRRAPVALTKVIGEVARALTPDTEDKAVRLKIPEHDVLIEADEQLLRQVLFNLLLNASQAVAQGGQIEVAYLQVAGGNSLTLEVRDDGPGVAPELRTEIFKPYVTMHQNGTGLGLAIVQQIVAAHGWEIECAANEPRGAVFRIRHLAVAPAKKS